MTPLFLPGRPIGYDCWATFYDSVYERGFGNVYQRMTESHLKLLDGLGRKVLDVGAGTGRIAVPLAQRGWKVTAVEPSAGMLQQLNTRATNAGVANLIHQVCQRIEEIADADGVSNDHDVALCVFTTIHHLLTREALSRALAVIAKSLHKGGVAIIGVHPPGVFQSFRDGISRTVAIPELGGNVEWRQIATPIAGFDVLDTTVTFTMPDGRQVID